MSDQRPGVCARTALYLMITGSVVVLLQDGNSIRLCLLGQEVRKCQPIQPRQHVDHPVTRSNRRELTTRRN